MKRAKAKKQLEKEQLGQEPFEYECSPYIKQTIVLFMVASLFLIFGTVALCYHWLPGAVLMYVIYVIFVFLIAKALLRQDSIDYGNYRRNRKAIDDVNGRCDTIETNLDLKADKLIKSNIRPGSRPSEAYKLLIGGEAVDGRGED